ncbi:MAG: serine/threonine-protein kinase [Acidimicrobiales bacterium]
MATDLVDDTQVVVKRAVEADLAEDVGARLEHEAEVLRRLSTASAPPVGGPERPHERVIGLACDGGCIYLVQPFVPGVTLAELVSRGPLSPASTLQVGIGVLSSLQHAHDHQVLHRDVKPANVIVEQVDGGGDDGPTVGRAVLVDFGFALSSSLAPSLRDERVGTVRYLAPEAAGLLSGAVDERSDLYSVGILIFECLAGEPPFEGADVGTVLQQHLSAAVPRLGALGVDVPRALDAVVQRLLRKDPSERYQTAGAALADLSAIADGMERGVREPTVVIGLHDRGHALTEPAFVARDAELSRLAGLIGRARETRRGGLVLL